MAGSFLACWVLGIRDRHQDNMMIKDNSIFFHIDFGFVLNEQPGFDAPIFSIPRGVRKHLAPNEWDFFLKVCGDAFVALHRLGTLIMQMCEKVFSSESISSEQVRRYLSNSLMIGQSAIAAKNKIRSLVIEGSNSVQKEAKYFVHDLAQKMRKDQ